MNSAAVPYPVTPTRITARRRRVDSAPQTAAAMVTSATPSCAHESMSVNCVGKGTSWNTSTPTGTAMDTAKTMPRVTGNEPRCDAPVTESANRSTDRIERRNARSAPGRSRAATPRWKELIWRRRRCSSTPTAKVSAVKARTGVHPCHRPRCSGCSEAAHQPE